MQIIMGSINYLTLKLSSKAMLHKMKNLPTTRELTFLKSLNTV